MSKPVILTAPRVSNDLHLGNYLGAFLPMADMARKLAGEYQFNFFIADLHGLTTPIDYDSVQPRIMDYLRVIAASGFPLDHEDVFVYRQSFIPAHSELAWILECFTGFGEMSRMTQFKDKAHVSVKDVVKDIEDKQQNKSYLEEKINERNSHEIIRLIYSSIELVRARDASVGLFNYPVLMAADILLYHAKYVPVGDDQTQHLEFTRDIAERMNSRFGELFVVPEPVQKQHEFFGKDQGLRIRDLGDPTKKMSKSDETGKGVIFLNDTPELAAKKVMAATTDSLASVNFDFEKQPGVTNLLQIFALLTNRPQAKVNEQWQGKSSYGELKTAVAEKVSDFLTDFQAKLAKVNDEKLTHKLEASEYLMNEVAAQTLLKVQQAVGLRQKS